MPSQLDLRALGVLLKHRQHGVVSRRQVLELGGNDDDVARLVRRRILRAVHPGVYVDHTGALDLRQRQWAAVLAAWPAALSGVSALPHEAEGPAIELAVAHDRRITPPAGTKLVRMVDFDRRVFWPAGPPSIRVEHAVVDVAARHLRRDDPAEAYAVLARACDRATDPHRIAEVLGKRDRVTGRRLLNGMLDDLATGANSVLERGYLTEVERSHGLPRGTRQRRSSATGRRTFQDVRYDAYAVVVELDGRAFHDSAHARDADAARDLAELAVNGDATVRLTYGQVYRTPCATAAHLAVILRRGGWTGAFRQCRLCVQGV